MHRRDVGKDLAAVAGYLWVDPMRPQKSPPRCAWNSS